MEVQGHIKVIGETKEFGSNGFTKREVVVTTEDQYPQHILIEFVKDKCNDLNNFKVGQKVVVSVNLNGREWVNPQGETKYFNSIQGWKIAMVDAKNSVEQAVATIDAVIPPADEDDQDLPF